MEMTEFIDTHVHWYDEMYHGSEEEAIGRALAAGVTKMIQADVDGTERDRMFEISERHPDVLYSMAGLYPGSVAENWEEQIEEYKPYISRGVVAIGEIGLDYHYSRDTAPLQMAALEAQFALASELDLPVNIHLREATDDFFKVLDRCRHLGIRGNMHAFSGSYETFLRLQNYGDWSIGVGGVVTFKKATLAEVVRKVPLDKIVLETDGPYLAPVPFRGTVNESAHIPVIAAKIAELKGIDIEEVASATTANAARLFNL